MGLLDSLLGSLGGGSAADNPQAALLAAIVEMLSGGGQAGGAGGVLGQVLGSAMGGGSPVGGGGAGIGGLGGLLEQFSRAGMGNVAQSWINTGDNLPISPDQLGQVLGQDRVSGMASQLQMNQGDLLGQLSQMLPQVVDKLTPQGRIPPGDLGGMGDLGSLLGGLDQR